MMMDGPVIDYGSTKKKEMGNSAADVKDMDDLADKWAEKKQAEGSMAGESFSLDGFLKGKA